jgi:cbb3-type cytochrome oxidase maturation protein
MYILIPVATILTALGIYLFFWAVKTEQFDDLEKQGMSILFNDTKDSDIQNAVTESNQEEGELANQLEKNNNKEKIIDTNK